MENHSSDNYRHILKYTSLFGGVQGLNILIGIVRNKLVALILGPAGMGLVSLYNSTITLLSTLTGFGMSMSGVKRTSEAFDFGGNSVRLRETIRLIRSMSFVAAVFGVVVTAVLSGLLSQLTFGDYSHTWGFVALSPMVGMMAIITGELAVMKGVRMLRQLAKVSVFNVVAALIVSVPLFYFYGWSGIIPSFLLLTFIQFVFTLRCSCSRFPWRISLRRKFLSKGNAILRLGMAFVLAGVFGTGADYLIRLFLNGAGNLDAVGLYNAGYMITMVYGGLVFSAMETDYFPRLSAVAAKDVAQQNDVVNKQVEVSLMVISPMLCVFITFLPIILPLMFSNEFLPVLPMVQVAAIAMFLRALRLPMSYIALARAESRSYLFLEGMYAVIVVPLVCLAFRLFGIIGTGYALLLIAVVDYVMLSIYTYCKFGYAMSKSVLWQSLAMLPLVVMAYVSSQLLHGVAYWAAGCMVSAVCLVVSLCFLRNKTKR